LVNCYLTLVNFSLLTPVKVPFLTFKDFISPHSNLLVISASLEKSPLPFNNLLVCYWIHSLFLDSDCKDLNQHFILFQLSPTKIIHCHDLPQFGKDAFMCETLSFIYFYTLYEMMVRFLALLLVFLMCLLNYLCFIVNCVETTLSCWELLN
jgi:hypothetical protein